MKKLSINKMSEYPTIDLDEQMMIKGGCEMCEQYGYGEGEVGHLSEVVISGRNRYYQWEHGGSMDVENCPACPPLSPLADRSPGEYFGQLLAHYFYHKEAYCK